MALCLAESLITKREFDPIDQLERYLKWYKEGYLSSNGICFDVGITILSSLMRFKELEIHIVVLQMNILQEMVH
jgi:ADP-ribosyl-[dinitrogen reductase] hydrolase